MLKFLIALCLFPSSAYAKFGLDVPLENKVLEQQAKQLFSIIRCQVCDGQVIADSETQLAISMRAKIRELVSNGKNDNEIKDYLSQRYGSDISTSYSFEQNKTLWIAPLSILVIAFGALFFLFFNRQKA